MPIARGRIIEFIPFPRALVLCEIQSASSGIWTCVVMSISYDDNHYTISTSIIHMYRQITSNTYLSRKRIVLSITTTRFSSDTNIIDWSYDNQFINSSRQLACCKEKNAVIIQWNRICSLKWVVLYRIED